MGGVEQGLFKWNCHRVFPALMEKQLAGKQSGGKLDLGSEAFTHNNEDVCMRLRCVKISAVIFVGVRSDIFKFCLFRNVRKTVALKTMFDLRCVLHLPSPTR